MELRDYLATFRKRWASIATLSLLTLMGAAAMTWLTTPTYEARSQVFVSVRTGGTTSDLLQGSTFTQNQVTSYRELVTSPRVLTPVIEHLELETTPDELARHIRADAPLNSVLITIAAVHEDAQMAANLSNATANSLATEVTELERPEDGPSPVKISTVRTASPPSDPSSPDPVRNLALGLLLGLALGFGTALLREVLDTRIHSESDVRHVTEASVIGAITHDDQALADPLIPEEGSHSQRAEAFRRLRTNIQFLDLSNDLRSLVVSSALPGEGKTTTTVNLAIMLAEAGSKVVLVDADLRRPSIARYMGIEGTVGLTTVLIGQASLSDVIQPWGRGGLHVLPSGQVPPNPSELLGSAAMRNLLDTLTDRYDIVLIDTPPLLPVTDAAVLAPLTGGAVVVVGINTVHRHQLADAFGALNSVSARVLGIVLNRVPPRQLGSYTYYDYTPIEAGSASRRQRTDRRKSTRAPRSGARSVRKPTTGRQVGPAIDRPLDDLLDDASDRSQTNRWPGGPIESGDR